MTYDMLLTDLTPLIISASIILTALVIGIIVYKWFFRILIKISNSTDTDLDDALLKSLRLPFSGLIVLGGIYVAMFYFSNVPQAILNKTLSVLLIFFLFSLYIPFAPPLNFLYISLGCLLICSINSLALAGTDVTIF